MASLHCAASSILALEHQRVAVFALVRGLEEVRADQHLRCACAFAAAQLQHAEVARFAVILHHRVQFPGLHFAQVGQQLLEIIRLLRAHPGEKVRFAAFKMGLLHAGDRLLDARHRQRRTFDRERAALAVAAASTIATKVHLVMRHQLAVHALAFAVDADVAGFRLCATVMATRHAYAQIGLAAGQLAARPRCWR